jgi:hypothetical protein
VGLPSATAGQRCCVRNPLTALIALLSLPVALCLAVGLAVTHLGTGEPPFEDEEREALVPVRRPNDQPFDPPEAA